MPRFLPIRFTFPFPPSDQPFPSSVQVTGNFEDWSRSHKAGFLHRNEQEGRFETELEIDLDQLDPIEGNSEHEQHHSQHRKVIFKFVLDGHNWVTDPAQLLERDPAGNLNNVCEVDDITPAEKLVEQQHQQQQPQQPTMTESTTAKTLVNMHYASSNNNTEDAGPLQDGWSPMAAITSMANPITNNGGDEHDGDGDYGVAIVQNETETISPKNSSSSSSYYLRQHDGQARPTIDASVTMTATSSSPPSTPMLSSPNSLASNSSRTPSTLYSSVGGRGALSSTAVPTISTSSVNDMGSVPISPTVKLCGSNQVQPTMAVPTTAISTLAPQFPSSVSLAQQPTKSSSDKRSKSGFWKKMKKVFA